ncbi:PilN domain-containing protein [Paenibacillus sp. 1001270B_150601_E10]|uniref:PilN domain-containing protein n=1 Tax=Paenibacillus sp. 1001270B_150601_E10 TaxID=2787079 RepID=UPI00189C7883|nr:hypothetical protein [Paenibacillus sp. 1001270B_150601_E10]
MLSDINLLPQREQRSFFFVIAVLILAAIVVLGSSCLIVYQYVLKQEQGRVEQEAKQLQKQIEVATSKLLLGVSASIMDQYGQIVEAVERLPLNTGLIIDQISSMLPTNGFFKSYSYVEPGVINIVVKFDNSAEAAQYVHHLTYAEWVDKVEISSLVKQERTEASQGEYEGTFLVEVNREAFLLRGEDVR